MDDSGFQTTRPGDEAQGYYEVDTDLKKLTPKDFECLDDGWKNKNRGTLSLNETWDWHQSKEATGGGVKISFYPQNFLMTFFSNRKLQQNNNNNGIGGAPINYGGGAPINKSRGRRQQLVGCGGAALTAHGSSSSRGIQQFAI